MAIQHICFDLDGTLVNSVPEICRAVADTCARFKIPLPSHEIFYSIFLRLFDSPPIQYFRSLGYKGSPEELDKEYSQHIEKYYHSVRPFEGTQEALLSLKLLGITLSILTANRHEDIPAFLNRYQLNSYFSEIILSDFDKTKMLQEHVRSLHIPPQQIMYIGDLCSDMRAAKEAEIIGVGHVGIVEEKYREGNFFRAGADYCISGLAELAPLVKALRDRKATAASKNIIQACTGC
ncbi:MAG TPA: HAD family hydrolase [Candidatus Paceibacterota bacterium]|nr:HAD family hydrolase [Candidatus Paceibacterota bacterium]